MFPAGRQGEQQRHHDIRDQGRQRPVGREHQPAPGCGLARRNRPAWLSRPPFSVAETSRQIALPGKLTPPRRGRHHLGVSRREDGTVIHDHQAFRALRPRRHPVHRQHPAGRSGQVPPTPPGGRPRRGFPLVPPPRQAAPLIPPPCSPGAGGAYAEGTAPVPGSCARETSRCCSKVPEFFVRGPVPASARPGMVNATVPPACHLLTSPGNAGRTGRQSGWGHR